MSNVAVYEGGCPYGQIELNMQTISNVLQGGAVGAGAGLVADFVVQKMLRTSNPLLRAFASVVVPIGIAYTVQRNNPKLAETIAIGGVSVGMYTLLKGLVGKSLGLQGFDYGEIYPEEEIYPEDDIEVTDGYEAIVPEVKEVEDYGIMVPEFEGGYNGNVETVIIEE